MHWPPLSRPHLLTSACAQACVAARNTTVAPATSTCATTRAACVACAFCELGRGKMLVLWKWWWCGLCEVVREGWRRRLEWMMSQGPEKDRVGVLGVRGVSITTRPGRRGVRTSEEQQ